MHGVINVLKPPGMTSHDVINFLRKTLGQKRIGHAGTLDPEAAGVLPVCVGQATKLVDYLAINDKEYLCHLTLGISTETQDAWGEVIEAKDASQVSVNMLEKAITCFLGEITQETPMYSAVKVNGVPLYKLARQGKTVDPKVRKVKINYLKILDFKDGKASLRIGCSKGTYIRTLCKDIGDCLGIGGHMSFLVRTGVGRFHIDDSLTIEEIAERKADSLLPVEICLEGIEKVVLEDNEIRLLKNGRTIQYKSGTCEKTIAILDKKGKLHVLAEIIIASSENKFIKPKTVFNLE